VTRRLLPLVLLAALVGLLAPYGSTRFAWLAGPAIGLLLWLLDRGRDAPVEPAPARRRAERDQAATVLAEPYAVK